MYNSQMLDKEAYILYKKSMNRNEKNMFDFAK